MMFHKRFLAKVFSFSSLGTKKLHRRRQKSGELGEFQDFVLSLSLPASQRQTLLSKVSGLVRTRERKIKLRDSNIQNLKTKLNDNIPTTNSPILREWILSEKNTDIHEEMEIGGQDYKK